MAAPSVQALFLKWSPELLKVRSKRLALPSVFVLGACSAPSGMDAGYDAGPGNDSGTNDSGVTDAGGSDSGILDAGMYDAGVPDGGAPICPGPNFQNDAGMMCTCEVDEVQAPDGGIMYDLCCDPDIGNPCPICCGNLKDSDGGREYYLDDGGMGPQQDAGSQPVCFC